MTIGGHPKNPFSSRNSALHMPLLCPKSKAHFPQPFPPQIPQLPTENLYQISAAPDLLNHLRAQIPQLLPDHSSQSPRLQLLAPKPLGYQHSHHVFPMTSPTKPSAPQASSNPNTPQPCTPDLPSHSPLFSLQGLPTFPTNSVYHPVPQPGPSSPIFSHSPQVFPPHHLPATFSLYRECYLPPSLPLTSATSLTALTFQWEHTSSFPHRMKPHRPPCLPTSSLKESFCRKFPSIMNSPRF